MTTRVQRTLSVSNATENLSKVRNFVTQAMRDGGIGSDDENRIILAVDEAVSNIIEHAFETTTQGVIKVDVEVDLSRCCITIHDSGKRFDPLSVVPPDLENHIRSGRKRGLGVFLMRQIMDEVHYHFKADVENVLTLIKNLG
ncbi:MAG: ATP-binding protein [Planctomycetota bacterium]|nr:ATP-binding protein [Planctomycetota bacterium]